MINADSRLIVDGKTGEQIGEINPGDRIVRANSVSAIKQQYAQQKNENKLPWKIDDFYKVFVKEQKLLSPDLSHSERSFLFAVSPYVTYDNDIRDDKGEQMGTEALIVLTGFSRNVMYSVIKSLIEIDVLYRGKNSKGAQYFINPWIICKGRYVSRTLQVMFKNYRIRALGGKRWGDIIYK